MNIVRYVASIFCKLGISALAAAALWMQLDRFGLDAWRLLETWLLALASIYYIGAIIKSWFSRKSGQKLKFCPFVQGTILMLSGCLIVFWSFCQSGWLVWPGADSEVTILALAIVPLLALLDWLVFSQKGNWRASYPWQWLGIIISFCCILILTANLLPKNSLWKYPYEFLNYNVISIPIMLCFGLLISVIVLVIGYALLVTDYVLSGEFGKHVVIPRIKTVIIEEDEPKPKVTTKGQPSVKPIKDTTKATTKTTPAKLEPATTKPKVVKVDPNSKSAHKLHQQATKTNTKSRSEIIADIKQQVGKPKNGQHRKTKK